MMDMSEEKDDICWCADPACPVRRDAKKIADLESRLKESEEEVFIKCKQNGVLLERLSQAEAKEQELRENWLEDMQEWSVEKAHLMDVGGRMSSVLEEGQHMILRSLDSAGDDEHEFLEKAKKVNAEWDQKDRRRE